MPVPGDTLGGRYALLRMLGEGGMGQVFEARNQNTGRRVAIKTLHNQWSSDPSVVQRFLREARAATSISHPNVVDVLDLDTDPAQGFPYIVQEYLVGESLEEHLDAQPGNRLSPLDSLRILVPVVNAMVAAHRKGVIHRDLKPANIFLTRDPSGTIIPKVIDFGIARVDATIPENGLRTGTGTTIGTPAYMSPEQAAGASDVDARTDVWAVGVVLYGMLTGRLPYEAPNANLLIGKILYERPTPVTSYAEALPTDLLAILDRALAHDRAARFTSMAELETALLACSVWRDPASAVLASTPSLPAPPPPSRTLASPPSLSSWSGAPKATRPRSRGPLFAGLGALAALVAVVAWMSISSRPPPVSPNVAPVRVAAPRVPPPEPAPPVVVTPPAPVVVAPVAPVAPPTPVAPVAPEEPVSPRARSHGTRRSSHHHGPSTGTPAFDTSYQ